MTVHLAPSSPRCSGHFRLAGRSLWGGGWFPGGAWVTPVPRLTHKACLLFPLRAGFVRMRDSRPVAGARPWWRLTAGLLVPALGSSAADRGRGEPSPLCLTKGPRHERRRELARVGALGKEVGSRWCQGGGARAHRPAGVARSQGVMRSQTPDLADSLRTSRAASNHQKPPRTSRVQPKNPRLRSLRTWV